jgi:adenosylcobinamide-GDP ribazoletransferase
MRKPVLRIMKDSRIGAFGVLGLGFAVALRAGGLMAQPDALDAALVLVVSGCLGRLLMLAAMALVPPSRDMRGWRRRWRRRWGRAAWRWRRRWPRRCCCSGCGSIRAGWRWPAWRARAFLAWYARMLRRRLGGGTGDLYGAAGMAGIVLATLAFVPDAAP